MSAIQAYLADVGITFKAELVEGDLASILWTAPADQTNGPSAVDWDICYAANAALSLHEYYDRYRTGSATNSHTPEDPELNALIDATSASADVNVQNEAFRALIEYENEDLFCMALYYQPIFLITSDRISGMKVGTASIGTSRTGPCPNALEAHRLSASHMPRSERCASTNTYGKGAAYAAPFANSVTGRPSYA